MKRARIISSVGCLAVFLTAGCGGVGPNSSANPLGGVASQGAMDVRDTTKPRHRWCPHRTPQPGFYVKPGHKTIKVNQQLTLVNLYSYGTSYGHECVQEPATWTASGGVIQPEDGGMSAVFYAASPGVYRVKAMWGTYHDHATVTVTSS